MAAAGLFCALNFMLSRDGRRAGDYQLVIKKYVKRDEGQFLFVVLFYFCLYSFVFYSLCANALVIVTSICLCCKVALDPLCVVLLQS